MEFKKKEAGVGKEKKNSHHIYFFRFFIYLVGRQNRKVKKKEDGQRGCSLQNAQKVRRKQH